MKKSNQEEQKMSGQHCAFSTGQKYLGIDGFNDANQNR